MLKLCVFIVSLLSVSGALLGAKKCTWGPSYWCQSFEKANECSAMQHCREKVWTTGSPSLLSSEVSGNEETDACTYCKDIIADVKSFIESNKTQTTIIQYMNRACDFMPDEYSMQECKKIEQHYLDEFEQCIKDNVDPDTLCKLVRLCSTSSTQRPAQQFSRVELKSSAANLRVKDDQICEWCKSGVQIAKTELDNPKTQESVKNFLMNECKQLGGDLQSECEMLVPMLLPELFSFLDKELTDQLCYEMGVCTNSTGLSRALYLDGFRSRVRSALRSSPFKKALVKVSRANDACDTCEEVAGYIKIFLSNNATEQEVEQLLENNVCTQLGEFEDMCKTLVEEYLPQLFSLLLQELDPATICTDLGLCTNTSALLSTPQKAVPQVKVRAKASPQCILCEFVMDKLEDILSKNATEQEIIQAVEKVCSILPQSIQKECDDFIEEYGPTIISFIKQAVSPSQICSVLGLCSQGDSMFKKPLGDDTCTVCEVTIKYLQSLLEKNSTQEQVMHAIEKVCNFLGGDIAQQCNTMVESYGHAILKLIADDIQPDALCTTLGLCKANTVRVDGLVHLYNTGNY